MKRIVFILFLLSMVFTISKEEKYIIPDDAIRFRVIANSNSLEDQEKKVHIKNVVQNKLKNILNNSNSMIDSKNRIKANLNNIGYLVSQETQDYTIKYGYNYFPEKEYRKVIYPEGYYESLVITLGDGIGDNWWCVLYPPLCFIDENETSHDYDLYVKKIFSKLNS